MDSNLGISAFLAAILILVIAALRRRLVFEIQGASLIVFGNPKVGVYLYSLFFLPGTILHELSHWIVAEILQVPTGKFEVLPDLETSGKGEEKLGYVMTGRTGPFRGFMIGIAPLVTGILSLVFLGYYLDTLRTVSAPIWQIILVVYGLIVVSNSMILSGSDRRNWPVIAILAIMITAVVYYLGISLSPTISEIISNVLYRINQALGLTIGLNLAMILGSFSVRRGLERLTNRKVMRGSK